MTVAFSSSDVDVINRKLNLEGSTQPTPEEQIDILYEVSRCEKWLKHRKFKRVVLQFPNSMLVDSGAVELSLKRRMRGETKFFTAADNSYESCCVDETAVQKIDADAVIHFGHACLSSVCRYPVLYVYVNQPLDLKHVVQEFKVLFPDKDSNVVVLYDVVYDYAIDELIHKLREDFEHLIPSKLCLLSDDMVYEDKRDSDLCRITKFGRYFDIPKSCKLENCRMFYIGCGDKRLTSLMMAFNKCQFYSYDPFQRTGKQETLDINRCLRKRYYYIEKAKDAKRVAILVRHSSLFYCRDIIEQLKTMIRSCNKRDYVVCLTTLNTAKLANYAEADVFVYVTCPETVVVDSHDFYRPIITPFEMEIACNKSREWTGDYILDFSEILPGAASHVPISPRVEPEMSLITGKMRSMECESGGISSDTSLAVRGDMTVASLHVAGAGEFLANRSWRGLEPCIGETPVAEIVQGKKGIACGYEGEGSS